MTESKNQFGVFKTVTIGHSDTPPYSGFYPKIMSGGNVTGVMEASNPGHILPVKCTPS